MTMTSLPVPVEQAFLETYAHLLSQFAFDKAKDLAEKEKDVKRGAVVSGTPWFSVLTSLSHLALSEKTYFSLSFVVKKLFRKDSLRSSYLTLIGDLKKIQDMRQMEQHLGMLSEVCRHFGQYVEARLELMDFYEHLFSNVSTQPVDYFGLMQLLEDVHHRHSKGFHHPILDPMKTTHSYEVDVLLHLLKAQCEMSKWQFLPSILHIHESQSKLKSWEQLIPPQSGSKEFVSLKKGLFSSSSKKHTLEAPVLFQWLNKFQAALVSKFTLYFHSVLSAQTSTVDMKSLTAKTEIDFHLKIASFHKRSDVFNVSIILDTHGIEDSYQGPGYHLPHVKSDPPSGLHSYPAVFSYPGVFPQEHCPNIVSIMIDRASDLNCMDKTVYFFDSKLQVTYFMTKIEAHMTLVVTFRSKRAEKDSYVMTFMSDIGSLLRNSKVFAMLG